MKQLWAPWRMEFLNQNMDGCIFCTIFKETTDQENLILFRGSSSYIVLNRFPYTSGHLLIVTNSHIASIEDLDPDSQLEIMDFTTRSVRVLRKVYKPEGFNIGTNIGKSAGAGVVDHLHFHIVPRWSGDANYMESLAETKVIPESLDVTYKRIASEWLK